MKAGVVKTRAETGREEYIPPGSSMAGKRIFGLDQVNKLVPRLNLVVGEQLQRRAEIEAQLKDLARVLGAPPSDLAPAPGDSDDVRARKVALGETVRAYEDGWTAVEEMGGELKDPRTGLVDFHGRVGGQIVWLCWKYGETQIAHYHALDEGFSGRKPIPEADGVRPLLN